MLKTLLINSLMYLISSRTRYKASLFEAALKRTAAYLEGGFSSLTGGWKR